MKNKKMLALFLSVSVMMGIPVGETVRKLTIQ